MMPFVPVLVDCDYQGKRANQANPFMKRVARNRRVTGKKLNDEWKVGAQHALYRETGTFYMNLERFPGALFDRYGYIIFPSRQALENCPGVVVKCRTDVKGGISNLPGYVRVCADYGQRQGIFPENPPTPYQPKCCISVG